MWKRFWQWLKNFLRRLFSTPTTPKPTPEPEVSPMSDAGYEQLLMQVLEGVASGWTRDRLLAEIGDRTGDRFFHSWLHRFGKRLLASPVPNRELGRRLVCLSELHGGRLSEIAGEYGRQLRDRPLPPLSPDEYEPMFDRLLQATTQGAPEVSAFLADLSPRVSIPQWTNWLRGYGETLLAEKEPDQTTGKALLRLSEQLRVQIPEPCTTPEEWLLWEFSQVAEDIGREVRSREIVWEIWEYTENS